MRKLDRVVYRTRKEHLYHPDLGAYNSYGIAIFVKYNHKTLDYISDVDVSRQRAKKIAALLNRFAVHPHDVRDVIEDIRDDPNFYTTFIFSFSEGELHPFRENPPYWPDKAAIRFLTPLHAFDSIFQRFRE